MLHSDIVSAFFQHLLSFQNKMEPVCVINDITIATADDITTLSDDVNIYPVDLSGTIKLWVMILIGEKNAVISDQYFFQFVVSHFGNSPMATECRGIILSMQQIIKVLIRLRGCPG